MLWPADSATNCMPSTQVTCVSLIVSYAMRVLVIVVVVLMLVRHPLPYCF
jgi:hypothetical protein